MKHYTSFISLLFFLVFSGFCFLHAQESIFDDITAEELYASGVESYELDKVDAAIDDLISCLQLNPQHNSAKLLLGLCLAEIVTKYYKDKKYMETMPYIEKLIEMFPDDPETLNMYNNVIKWSERQQARLDLKSKDIETPTFMSDSTELKQEEISKKFEEEQQVLMDTILRQVKKMQMQFEAKIKKREEGILTTLIKTNIITAAGTAAIIIILILSIFIYFHKAERRREKIMMSSYEKIADKLSPYITDHTKQSLKPREFPKMLDSMNTEGLLHGIEIIDAELVTDISKDMRERLLEYFLKDSDVKVKSRALQTLYKHNPDKALDGIKKMSKEPDASTRICAAEILSKIPSKESVSLLLSMKEDIDEKVERAVLKSLSIIYEEKKETLHPDMVMLIEKYLKEAKDEWVFK